MRTLTATALAAACALASAAPAHAAGTQRVLVDRFTEPYEFAIDCGDYGPYDFVNEVSGVQRVSVVEVLAADGTLVRTEYHISLRETETNSETGESLPLKATVREVVYEQSNMRTLSGVVWMANEPGKGTVIHSSGRATLTLDTPPEPLFLAGPHDVLDAGGVDFLVCKELAAT